MSARAPPNFIERSTSRFLSKLPSVRTAANAIVKTTAAVVLLGTYDEDRLGDRSFLFDIYCMAVKPSVADISASIR